MLKRFAWMLLLLPITAMASFGAAGNKVNYLDDSLKLDYTGQGAVVVLTQDLRKYVLSHDKEPDFVGLIRGGFNNPFGVRTESGHALSDDLNANITAALKRAGYSATAETMAADETVVQASSRWTAVAPARILLIQIREWKSDTHRRTELFYDVSISPFKSDGSPIDSVTDAGTQVLDIELKGLSLKPVLAGIAAASHDKWQGWLNDAKIRDALGGTTSAATATPSDTKSPAPPSGS